MDMQEINDTLDREIEEMHRILEREAGGFASEGSAVQCGYPLWWGALKSIPMPVIGKEGLVGLYQNILRVLLPSPIRQDGGYRK